MFSSRLRRSLGRNRLAQAVDARRAAGLPILDLTLSNPTAAGFHYPPDLLAPLADPAVFRYDPEPFGLLAARQAVAGELASHGCAIGPDGIVLTASTSEAYSLLLKLLCNPGDVVLAPRPSYPLVEHLAELEAVQLEQYRLEFHGRWTVDLDGIARRISQPAAPPVRAIFLISPNNPTGSVMSLHELQRLSALAAEHQIALVCDEVFADYAMDGGPLPGILQVTDALVFSLGGLSKAAALPQMKLAWIATGGPRPLVDAALERLEVICDAYLSVGTPVQVALSAFLAAADVMRGQIRRRVTENLARLRQVAAGQPACTVLPVEAGWYAVVQVPAIRSEEDLVLGLLERSGVLVHPGYFFDFEREAYLVISLLPPVDVFARGTAAALQQAGAV